MKKTIEIIGGGCAGFTFIKNAKHLKNFKIKIYTDLKEKAFSNHYWSFWNTMQTFDASIKAERKWYKWKIITNESEKIFQSSSYPYCTISRRKWIKSCELMSKNFNVKIINETVVKKNKYYYAGEKKLKGDFIFDSRPPKFKKNTMLQHFYGLVFDFEENIFDEDTAILMDFRCDQSKGIHFIYLLPFSRKKALIESTLFSKKIEDYDFYVNSIKKYIHQFYKTDRYKISREESGIIPMSYVSLPNENSINIGTRGGATRPSSGYTFSFIQKQIDKIICQINQKKKIKNNVHKKFDLLMDKIFLDVLDKNKNIMPDIFLKLSSNLSGDEMAKFMSGEAKLKIWFKIIIKMPKVIFLSSLLSVLING